MSNEFSEWKIVRKDLSNILLIFRKWSNIFSEVAVTERSKFNTVVAAYKEVFETEKRSLIRRL